jgi:hypothetical protein
MQEHVRTFLRQAHAFIAAGDGREALVLLDKAQKIARDDRHLRARILYEQALAYDSLGDQKRALDCAHQALNVDPDLEGEIRRLAAAQQHAGRPGFTADFLAAISPPAPVLRRSLAHRPRVWIPMLLLVAGGLVGGFAYSGWKWPSVAGSGREGRFDIERVRENVGLVVVSAKFRARDGSSAEIPFVTGSCFAISPEGLLLTNKHVTQARESVPDRIAPGGELMGMREGSKIVVCFGPEQKDHLSARIVYESPYHDLALLKVERRFPRPFKLARGAQSGDPVYTAGYPGKVNDLLSALAPTDFWARMAEQMSQGNPDLSTVSFGAADYEVTVTRGVISARRHVAEEDWVQHDAVISAGNSGGPLMTPVCAVIGINTWKHTDSEGFNLALSLEQLKEELKPFVALD